MGEVNELMDKDIGRLVFRIKGAVSANNYISIDALHLRGPCFYIQYSQIPNAIATVHFEVTTNYQSNIRISLSTLYQNESPKFLGRSLR